MKLKSKNQKIFFTSDNHFGHKKIVEFCPKTRPFKDVDEHDRVMISTWQSQVGQDDIVFCLGDFSFSEADRTRNIIDQLPGTKVLIYGNHDKVIKSNIDIQKRFFSIENYMRCNIDDTHVVLFHFPIAEWDMMHRGGFHFHGHVHGKDMKIPGRIFDVSPDTRPTPDLKLWEWPELKRMMEKLPINNHH